MTRTRKTCGSSAKACTRKRSRPTISTRRMRLTAVAASMIPCRGSRRPDPRIYRYVSHVTGLLFYVTSRLLSSRGIRIVYRVSLLYESGFENFARRFRDIYRISSLLYVINSNLVGRFFFFFFFPDRLVHHREQFLELGRTARDAASSTVLAVRGESSAETRTSGRGDGREEQQRAVAGEQRGREG